MKNLILLACGSILSCSLAAQSNYALTFNGSSSVDCGNATALNIAGKTITVEAWIYPTSFSANYWEGSIVAKDYNNQSGYTLRCGGSGKLSFVFAVTGPTWAEAISGNNALVLNQWQHVAGVYNGTDIRLYVNGMLVQTTAETRSLVEDPTYHVMIGYSPGPWVPARTFTGSIDEARVWNVARSQAEIRKNLFKSLTSGTGLVASYSMNAGSGTSLTDNSGNGNTGTLSAGVTWVSSPVNYSGNALAFDGTNDHVTIAHQAAHDISTAITLEAWVYATSTTGIQNVICKSNATTNNGYIFPRTDDGWAHTGFWLYIGGAWRVLSAAFPGRNAWHHLAATYDGTTMKLYTDGVLSASQAQTGAITTNTNDISIGNQMGVSEYYGGYLDECRVWNVAKTLAEIQSNMNNEIDPAAATGLVLYYDFDQGIASGTNSGLNFIPDLAGTQNGVLNNFTMSGGVSNFITQKSDLIILPIKWLSFGVHRSGENAVLNWITTKESSTQSFKVQHSVNGTNWETLADVAVNSLDQYQYMHIAPGSGVHLYRIGQVAFDHAGSWSETRRLDFSGNRTSLACYPNPVTGGVLNVFLDVPSVVRLTDAAGRTVRQSRIAAGWQQIPTHGLSAGIYQVNTGEKSASVKIVIR